MKHTLRILIPFLLFVFLLGVLSGAQAADTSKGNCENRWLKSCTIMALKTNLYTPDRPVIIFMPGGNECGSITDTVRWLRRYQLYDQLDVDLIAVSFRRQPLKPSDWKNPCDDLLAFLKENAPDSPVIIDAVSLAGYGGCYLAQILNENGIPVKELNMADACVRRYITEDWLRLLAGQGTQVNLWGCGGKTNVSVETRKLITALEGTENIQGVIVDADHGAVLHTAICSHGLHEEYKEKAPDETDAD